jgi:hypothetical protein
MKYNAWTLTLAAAGVVSLTSVAYAEEQVMSQVLTSVSSTTLGGYVDTSAIWKPGTGNGGAGVGNTLPGRAFDGTSKMDGFNLNVVGLTVEKPIGEDTWAAGYRADLLFGPDAVAYNAAVNAEPDSEFAVKQAYVALRAPMGNGLDIKMGVFNTIIGYESFESYLNPNYSRSYGWQIEPTQHTGVLASYELTEGVTFSAGIANTWIWGVNERDTRDYSESRKSFMGSLSITAPDSWGYLSGSAFYVGVVEGFSGNGKETISFYSGLSISTGVEGLSVGAAFDYRAYGPNAVTFDDNWAWTLAGYLSFQASEKWRLSARLDYATGSDGTFYNGGADMGIYDTADPGYVGSDLQNELFSVTGTADYALWANVITRAEIRWDTSLTDDKPFGITDENAVTVAANVIYKF